MAECCVQHHATQEEAVRTDLAGAFLKVGSAQNCKTVIRPSRRSTGAGGDDDAEDDGPLSLKTALLYLNNALALLAKVSDRADATSPPAPAGSPPAIATSVSSFALPGTYVVPHFYLLSWIL